MSKLQKVTTMLQLYLKTGRKKVELAKQIITGENNEKINSLFNEYKRAGAKLTQRAAQKVREEAPSISVVLASYLGATSLALSAATLGIQGVERGWLMGESEKPIEQVSQHNTLPFLKQQNSHLTKLHNLLELRGVISNRGLSSLQTLYASGR